jgi:hypothetical protein
MKVKTYLRLKFEPIIYSIEFFCKKYHSKCRDAECLEEEPKHNSTYNNNYVDQELVEQLRQDRIFEAQLKAIDNEFPMVRNIRIKKNNL